MAVVKLADIGVSLVKDIAAMHGARLVKSVGPNSMVFELDGSKYFISVYGNRDGGLVLETDQEIDARLAYELELITKEQFKDLLFEAELR